MVQLAVASSVRHECGSVWHESVSLPIRVQNKTAMQSIPQLLLRMGERAIMAHHQFMVKLEQGLLAYLFVDPKLPTLSEVESWRGQLGIGGSKCISTGLNPRLELWGLTEELGVIEKLVTALIDAKKHSGLCSYSSNSIVCCISIRVNILQKSFKVLLRSRSSIF